MQGKERSYEFYQYRRWSANKFYKDQICCASFQNRCLFGFSGQMSSSSSDNSTWLRRAALVGVAGVASAGVLYYILNRGRTVGNKKSDGGKAVKVEKSGMNSNEPWEFRQIWTVCTSWPCSSSRNSATSASPRRTMMMLSRLGVFLGNIE